MSKEFSEILRKRGFRSTPQRVAIFSVISESACHLSPLEIYQRVQTKLPGITEATVYRTLNFLAQEGLVLVAHVGNGQLMYELAGRDHHHLVCKQCGATYEIDHQFLSDLYARFQERSGYLIDGMHVTFFGLCPKCQQQDKQLRK